MHQAALDAGVDLPGRVHPHVNACVIKHKMSYWNLKRATHRSPPSPHFFLSGGVAPCTWSVASRQLPPGPAPRSAGAPAGNNNRLAGTPTGAGSVTFTVMVTDSTGQPAAQQLSLTIKGWR
ncbi:MAG TPA: hypothetical protein VGQ26_08355 [Streptosporangiaceae bacterium]|jgi:hypothetical protein|nr:hypothetical protein [Streptosporangiaceae bacterium]